MATGSASGASSWSVTPPKHKSPPPQQHFAVETTKPPFKSLLSKLRSLHKCSRSSPAVAPAIPSPLGYALLTFSRCLISPYPGTIDRL